MPGETRDAFLKFDLINLPTKENNIASNGIYGDINPLEFIFNENDMVLNVGNGGV